MRVKDPPIDWLLAAILERKHQRGLSFEDLAQLTEYSAGSLQNMFKRSPWSWSFKARSRVCEALGISQEEVMKLYGL